MRYDVALCHCLPISLSPSLTPSSPSSEASAARIAVIICPVSEIPTESTPMYHPTTRLLTILELLQTHHALSGAELARRLEVEPRSVRRYIMMLQDMGMPIQAVRGPGGGYQLRPGFKLPPLMFTEAEATALVLGLLGTAWLEVDQSTV